MTETWETSVVREVWASQTRPGVVFRTVVGVDNNEGTSDHSVLTNRAAADQHPIGAVTGLQGALDGKVSTSDQRLSDARTPTAHKSTHGTGGTDEIAPADIGARPAGNVDWSEIDNKPSIPAAQVNSDWTASSGVAQILHKPTIPSAPADIGAAPVSHVHGAADITSGVIAAARLGTGTADATTVLHGDGTWGAGVSSGYRAQFLLGGM